MTRLHLLALPAAACMFAVSLLSADFWQSKPFTEWNDKDVQKLLQSSPWAKPLNVAGPAGSASSPEGLDAFGGVTRHKAVNTGDSSGTAGPATVVPLVVRWQSARPVREAAVKAKYGNEAGTSPEAKKTLEEMGGQFRSLHMTMGEYDLVGIFDAPDDAVAARFSVMLGQTGNVRTTSLKAFPEEAFRQIIASLP